jgi:HprK-related kinase B
VADVPVQVATNSREIAFRLEAYYAPYLLPENPGQAGLRVRLIQGEPELRGAFADVDRGPGRKVKEAVQEVPGGRLVLKRATGVLMGLGPGEAWAWGDLLTHLNQGINLINACYAKAVMRRGHLLLHASGVSWAGRAAALAGPPGAGKSSAALHLVEAGYRFLSNDRVLARPGPDGVEALGYPKQPRVNPGTLLRHPRLADLLSCEERAALLSLPSEQVWLLERKRDIDLDQIYGKGTVELSARLDALVLLKWDLKGRGFSVRRLDAAAAVANVPFMSRNLGVFDLDRSARVRRLADRLGEYRELLEGLRVIEVTGGVDFHALVEAVDDLLR